MQNLSLLQLLKMFSDGAAKQDEQNEQAAPAAPPEDAVPQTSADEPPMSGNNAEAYARFIEKHEQSVRRSKKP